MDVCDETGRADKSVGLVLVQKSLLLSFCKTSVLNKVINLEVIQQYYDHPVSNVTFRPHNKKRKLSQEKRRKKRKIDAERLSG